MTQQITQTFNPPSYDGKSPLEWYNTASKLPGFITDPAQKIAVEYLNDLYNELVAFKEKRNRFLGRSWRSPAPPRGLYFYGGVGRGKSFLMDMFYGCLPYKRKKRIHFHVFMSDIHQRLQNTKHTENPLKAVAKQIATEVRVLCLDEFHVSDIADAMILGRLLEGLISEGIVLVTTSNYEPSELYPQGQNRSSFLPTIDLIKEKLTILNVDGGQDHRLRTLKQADIFHVPDTDINEQKLHTLFDEISYGKTRLPEKITILGRTLPVLAHADGVVWFDFRTLCFGPRSQQDYLFLAQNYRYLFISHIEKMSQDEKSEARRLTWLIDVLYDYRVKMCATLCVSINELYTEGDFANEFTRTASRMMEMQSETYLQQAHLTLDKNDDNPTT